MPNFFPAIGEYARISDTSTDADTADAVDVPAGGTGTAAGGWDTAANRDDAISRINLAWDLLNELKADFNALRDTMQEMLLQFRDKGLVK